MDKIMNAADMRRFLAEEIRVVHNIKSPRVIDAIATVPREQFLPPGPWQIRGGELLASFFSGSPAPLRHTDDADPRHVYHDLSIAIDPSRDLYNGQPSFIATWLDLLRINEGDRVLHIGTGMGYYTALIAHIVGPSGMVHGIEIDPALARTARNNLDPWPWASVHEGNGSSELPSNVDVVVVHAGSSHILDVWLDVLANDGRLLVPLTVAMPDISNTGSKGMVLVITRDGDNWRARFTSSVVIYSLQGIRDETAGQTLAKAMMSGSYMKVRRLRRDKHEPSATCWLHSSTVCLGE
jgi:protein-L-isoaspartate(D-aspartate) O-methyltransferase